MTTLKLVVLGSAAVGKSCFVIRWYSASFVNDYDPTLQDSYRKSIEVDNENYILDVYDTAGADDFQLVREKFIQVGEGFILIYSITNDNTFQEITRLHNRIENITEDLTLPILLAGNKCDLESNRQVSKEEGQKLAQTHNWTFFETSAKDNINVSDAIFSIVKAMATHKKNREPPKVNPKKKPKCIIL